MALNGTGAISLGGSTTGQSVNLELAKAATAQISFNDAAVRTLTGTSAGSMLIMPTNFYNKSNFSPSTTIYTTPGTYDYTIPSGYTTLQIYILGAGGGGGGAGNSPTAGTTGGASYVFFSPAIGLEDFAQAFGGNGGAAGTGGTTATAAGGSTSENITATTQVYSGNAGAAGFVGSAIGYGGAGGSPNINVPDRGTGGAQTIADASSGGIVVNTTGNAGSLYGAGGSGGARAGSSCKSSFQFGGGGGGGGGYVYVEFTSATSPYTSLLLTVGSGGPGGTASVGPAGGAGSNGRIKIVAS